MFFVCVVLFFLSVILLVISLVKNELGDGYSIRMDPGVWENTKIFILSYQAASLCEALGSQDTSVLVILLTITVYHHLQSSLSLELIVY